MPADADYLRAHPAPLEARGWSFVVDGAPWNDTSYLSEAELQDPSLRANVGAMAETNAMITFVLVHEDGEYVGYWHGPEKVPMETSPLVLLNNEGQYEIVGSTLAGAMVALDPWEDEDPLEDQLREWNLDLGTREPPVASHPNAWRDARAEVLSKA